MPGTVHSRLWRRCVVVVTVGELTGFVVPAVTGVMSAGWPAGAQLVGLVAAGAVEGTVLGAAQAQVLRSVLPGLRSRAWVLATAGGAALAWLLGMLPSVAYGWWSTWPVPLAVAVALPLGAALLLSIGTAHALVLPADAAPEARRWVAFTVLGWCAGLVVFALVSTPWWHEGQPTWQIVGIGLVGGVAMAATMASVTGLAVLRLSRSLAAVPRRRTGRP